MTDGTDTHDSIPDLKVSPSVPRQGRDPIAKHNAVAIQPLGDFQRAPSDLAIVGPMDRPLDRASHHLSVRMTNRGVINDSLTQQRPFLH